MFYILDIASYTFLIEIYFQVFLVLAVFMMTKVITAA